MFDTIFAVATAHGRAGVAIIRVSGTESWRAVGNLIGDLPSPKKSALRVVRNSAGEALDEALILTFESGASFTGERVAELHLHGSAAVISAVMRELAEQPSLRLAEPGEFTRRALDNGRLDLAQVEGLADLIDAETEAQRRQALKVMRGALSKKADVWRMDLLRAVALLEVTIDFADEEVPVDVTPEVCELIETARSGMKIEVSGSKVSERIRDGFEVAIIGRPNIGKSTLLNALAKREVAITSEIEGTTRDVIEVRMDLGGLPVTMLDTAGLREAEGVVEELGVRLAKDRATAADLRIFLLGKDESTEDFDVQFLPGDIAARGKADLAEMRGVSVSGLTGFGIDNLLSTLTEELSGRAAGASSAVRERHRVALIQGISALDAAETHVRNGAEWSDLAAEDMRQALRALDSLIGRVDVENILDVIFSSFCLGK